MKTLMDLKETIYEEPLEEIAFDEERFQKELVRTCKHIRKEKFWKPIEKQILKLIQEVDEMGSPYFEYILDTLFYELREKSEDRYYRESLLKLEKQKELINSLQKKTPEN
jgi:hypothetical protein